MSNQKQTYRAHNYKKATKYKESETFLGHLATLSQPTQSRVSRVEEEQYTPYPYAY